MTNIVSQFCSRESKKNRKRIIAEMSHRKINVRAEQLDKNFYKFFCFQYKNLNLILKTAFELEFCAFSFLKKQRA